MKKPKTLKAKNKHGLHACCGCGDPTTGSVSESTKRKYACCPDCCDRVDSLMDDNGEDERGDRGPYRERKPFPPCNRCHSKSVEQDAMNARLTCIDCGHAWRPRGIYLTKKQEKELAARR